MGDRIVGDEVTEVFRDKTLKSFEGYCKNFGIYYEKNRKIIKNFEQRIGLITFFCLVALFVEGQGQKLQWRVDGN